MKEKLIKKLILLEPETLRCIEVKLQQVSLRGYQVSWNPCGIICLLDGISPSVGVTLSYKKLGQADKGYREMVTDLLNVQGFKVAPRQDTVLYRFSLNQ